MWNHTIMEYLSIGFVMILGKSINNVALASSFSYMLYSFVVIFVSCKSLNKKFFNVLVISWLPVLFLIIPSILISIFVTNIHFQIFLITMLITLFLLLFYKNEIGNLIKKGGPFSSCYN